MFVCVFADLSARVCVCVCTGASVVFDDNEADRNRLSSELSMPPQTHRLGMGILSECACVCGMCVFVLACVYLYISPSENPVCECASVEDKRPKIPTRCRFNEINQKDGESKHFVLCDNQNVILAFPAVIAAAF